MLLRMHREDVFAVILIFAFALLFFYPVFQGRQPIPTDDLMGLYHPWRDSLNEEYPRGIPFKNFLITDPVRQQIPWRKLVVEEWRKGLIPSWNPFNFIGTPLRSNIQAATFYPLNLLFGFFEFSIAWTFLIMLQPFLSALFMYVYLRNLELHKISCLFGALAWSFSGFHIAWLTWGTIGHVSLWLPLILLAIDRLIAKTTKRIFGGMFGWSFVLALSLVVSFFAGHVQISLYIVIVSIIYSLWRIVQSKEIRAVPFLLMSFVFFVLISSIQWLPIVDLLKQSNRIEETASWMKEGWFLPWKHLVQFFVPDFFGNPSTLNYWGDWNYGEFVGFIGVLPLAFALYAIVESRETIGKIWKIILIICFSLMLQSPMLEALYRIGIPVFSSLQPTRLMVITDFSLAVLASIGINHWINEKGFRWGRVLLFLTIFYIFLLVIESSLGFIIKNTQLTSQLIISRRNTVLPLFILLVGIFISGVTALENIREKFITIAPLFFVVVTLADLYRFGWKYTPFSEKEYFFPTTKIIQFLQVQNKPFRVLSVDDRLAPSNAFAYYEIESLGGYDPIYFREFEELIAASERGKPDINPPYGFNRIIAPKNIDSPLLSLFNVRYILSLEDLNHPYLTKVFEEGKTKLYETTKNLPRMYFVRNVISQTDKKVILEELFKKNYEAKQNAYVEDVNLSLTDPTFFQNSVEMIQYQKQRYSFRTSSISDSFLVVSAMYQPNWRVFVNGQEAKLYKTNYVFTGVTIPKGEHIVEFLYRT